MDESINRRRVLAALGTGTAALAGCSATNRQTPRSEGSNESGKNTSTNSSNNSDTTNDGQTQAPPPAIQQGELVSRFENLKDWTAFQGQLSADQKAALVGSQAARIENKGALAGIYKAFPKGLDVSDRNLSLALRVDTPRPAKVTVQLRAPAQSVKIQSTRTIIGSYTGWLRMDVGYNSQRGHPNLKNVQEMRIFLRPYDSKKSKIRFFLDDLRATPAADQGYVVLSFDDGVASQFTNGFPMLKKRGMPGTVAVNANTLNVPNRLSIGQLRKLRDAGWDVSSHPENGFQKMNIEQIRKSIKANKEFLVNKGFPEGARHMFVPYNNTNQKIVNITRKHHQVSGYFGGTTSAVPFTDSMHLSRTKMSDLKGFSKLIDFAAQYNQLVVGYAHGVGTGKLDNITQGQLTRLLDYIEQSDVKVVTPSYLLDNPKKL